VHADAHELFNGTQPLREGFTSVKHDAGFLQHANGHRACDAAQVEARYRAMSR
jgi:hypothetical protein